MSERTDPPTSAPAADGTPLDDQPETTVATLTVEEPAPAEPAAASPPPEAEPATSSRAEAEPTGETVEMAAPEMAAPEIEAPEIEASGIEAPGIEAPEIEVPGEPAEAAAPEEATAGESEDESAEGEAAEGAAVPDEELPPEIQALIQAIESKTPVEGRVFGWNEGGFHVSLGGVPAFCPASQIDLGRAKEPQSYVEQTFLFRIIEYRRKRRRFIVSRASVLKEEREARAAAARAKVREGAVLPGRVTSLTSFGAFVDLGGVEGLVHVSEISRRRVADPKEVLAQDQEVEVKVLKVENGGKRISLSMKDLEPDPWADVAARYAEGSSVEGEVESIAPFGVFVRLEPGLSGLLPNSATGLAKGARPEREFPVGKRIKVQVVSVDTRRHRISLAREGSRLEGSHADYREYVQKTKSGRGGSGLNALAAAFEKLRE
jgi:predicted RNA-binding protein with RPS1 domain